MPFRGKRWIQKIPTGFDEKEGVKNLLLLHFRQEFFNFAVVRFNCGVIRYP